MMLQMSDFKVDIDELITRFTNNPRDIISWTENQSNTDVTKALNLVKVGQMLLDGLHIDIAFESLNKALHYSINSENQEIELLCYGLLGLCYSTLRQYNQVIPYYEQGLVLANKISHTKAILHYNYRLAQCYEQLKQYDKTIGYYEVTKTLAHKRNDQDLELLCFILLKQNYKKIGKEYHLTDIPWDGRKKTIKDPLGHTWEVGNDALVNSKTKSPLHAYNNPQEKSENTPIGTNYLLRKAQNHYDLKEYNQAIMSYDQIIAQDPNNSIALCNKGCVLEDTGRTDEAMACYFKAIEINPQDGITLNNIGKVFLVRNELDKALEYLNRSLTINPNYPKAISNKAFTLFNLKRYQEVIEFIRILPETTSENETLIITKGISLYNLKKYKECIEYMNKILILRPDLSNTIKKMKDNALSEIGH